MEVPQTQTQVASPELVDQRAPGAMSSSKRRVSNGPRKRGPGPLFRTTLTWTRITLLQANVLHQYQTSFGTWKNNTLPQTNLEADRRVLVDYFPFGGRAPCPIPCWWESVPQKSQKWFPLPAEELIQEITPSKWRYPSHSRKFVYWLGPFWGSFVIVYLGKQFFWLGPLLGLVNQWCLPCTRAHYVSPLNISCGKGKPPTTAIGDVINLVPLTTLTTLKLRSRCQTLKTKRAAAPRCRSAPPLWPVAAPCPRTPCPRRSAPGAACPGGSSGNSRGWS